MQSTREIKSSISVAKAKFNNKTLFTSKPNDNLKKKLVKCYIWGIVLYGDETWIQWKVAQKYPESF